MNGLLVILLSTHLTVLPDDPTAVVRPRRAPATEAFLEKLKPGTDEWVAEALADSAKVNLNRLGDELATGEVDGSVVGSFVETPFACSALRPPLSRTYHNDGLEVWHARADAAPQAFKDSTGFAEALGHLIEPLSRSTNRRFFFKVISSEPSGDNLSTAVLYQATGSGPVRVQQSATWHCEWGRGADEAWRLRTIRVSDFEEVRRPGRAMFADRSEAVLGRNRSWADQLGRGLDYWRGRIDLQLGITVSGHEGLALGDINNDGLDDLFVCQPGGLPNLMYQQNPDGTATDVSATIGVDFLDHTYHALLLDLNNDDWQDLVFVTLDDVFFMLNDRSGRFPRVSSVVRVPSAFSVAAADYDNDADLDIYICGYQDTERGETTPLPYHDANNGRANVLLRNEGRGRFVDVTRAVGLDHNNRRFSLAAAWEDYDNDGDFDIYVANDYGRNNLYRNDGGHFRDVAAQAGVEDISAGMSVAWSDYNNDGWMDLYVSNMFSAAGNRVTYQRSFMDKRDESTVRDLQRHARGNSLFLNAGNGTFKDVSVDAGVTMGRWAWSSSFIDINNDALQDIFVANGYVTNEDTKDL
jgi:hypothetical protein